MRAALALVLALVAAGCAGGSEDKRLTVFAAASLTEVFERLDPDVRFNFAGSDELAAQLEEGADADVYAAASPTHPDRLFRAGLIERPRVFATNRLVLIVPRDNPARIRRVRDLARPGTKLVVGAPGVPIGDYTREVLERLGQTAVLARVVSEEEDVKGVVGKVALGEADAGFAYATDVRAATGDVRALELPPAARAQVRYPVALVRGTSRRDDAERFLARLLGPEGRRTLREAGFGLP